MKMRNSMLTAAAALAVVLAGGAYAGDSRSDTHGAATGSDMKDKAGMHASKSDNRTWGDLASLDKLKGMKVNDSAGNRVGAVEDVLFDTSSGRIDFLVVGAGGVMGVGEKKHPVPFEATRFQADRKAVSLTVDKDRLTNAPEIRKDMSYSRDFARRVDEYYGVSPSFGSSGTEPSFRGRTTDSGMSSGSQGGTTSSDTTHGDAMHSGSGDMSSHMNAGSPGGSPSGSTGTPR